MVVERELPVYSELEAAEEAHTLLEACQAAAAYDWHIALALLLDNTLALAGERALHAPLLTGHASCMFN